MIETVAKAALAVEENLLIQKNRLCPEQMTEGEKRLCVVTGIHGDELEGQYICYALARRILEQREHLRGIVDIYPAVNPLGICSVSKGIPMFELDMNRIFPGGEDGAMAEYLASQVVQDIEGADLCLDIHSGSAFLREIPQVRVSQDTAKSLLPYARQMNADLIWVCGSPDVVEGSMASHLNKIGIPTLVVEMGSGMRINRAYGDQILDGIFHLMSTLGIWDGPCLDVKEPIFSAEGRVGLLSARESGVFIPYVDHWKSVIKQEVIGEIVDPLSAEVREVIRAPFNGMIFTLREYPVVTEGSLVARVLGGKSV